jgi:hypothetical protein
MCVIKKFGLLKAGWRILLKNTYLINLGLYPTWWMVWTSYGGHQI